MKRRLQLIAGISIAIFLLYYLFRGTQWGAVWEATRQAHVGWLLACVLFILVSFFVRVQRWSYIVRTAKPAPYRELFHATQIGFLANFVLPLRMGEAIRALVLGRFINLPFTKCFAFVALDRLTDLIGLVAMMFIGALVYVPQGDILLPPEIYPHPVAGTAIRAGVLTLALALAGVLCCFVLFYFFQAFALRLVGIFAPVGAAVARALLKFVLFLPGPVAALREKGLDFFGPTFTPYVQGLVTHFAEGMHIFRNTGDMLKTVFFSVITWLLLTGSYYSMVKAFSLEAPWYTAFLVVAMISAMISMPGAPGFIGQFHAGVIAGIYLSAPLLTQSPDTVKAVALVTHILHTLPVLAVGVYSLYATKFGLLELKREGEEVQESLEH